MGPNPFGRPIRSPEYLNSCTGDIKIIIASAYIEEITQQLISQGFKENEQIVSGISNDSFFLNEETSIKKFFENLEILKAKYVVIRNYEELPHLEGGDIDILIDDKDLPKLKQAGLITKAHFRRVIKYLKPK